MINNFESKYSKKGFLVVFFVFTLLFIVWFWNESTTTTTNSNFNNINNINFDNKNNNNQLRILYIVTTLSEYDNGKRKTTRGFDRFQNTLIPVVRESIISMQQSGYHVDLYLICFFQLQPRRKQLLRDNIPSEVGIQVWEDAAPISYMLENKHDNFTVDNTRALARQHRYVIKDKLFHYDLFVNFEDDMLIQGPTVQNYIQLTNDIYKLRDTAPDHSPMHGNDIFYGIMTKQQLARVLPGFIRVEVLLNEQEFGAQDELAPVPITNRPTIDPKYCCHFSNISTAVSDTRPANPTSDKLFIWETQVLPLGVRKMPLQSSKALEWVVLQRGPRVANRQRIIGDYWSGRDGYFGPETQRPDTKDFKYINNQGGWMATRQQIWEWHTEQCPGGFLPPYELPNYNLDGLDMRNVEYWSGGLSIFTKEHACNLQRIISLNPDIFAKQLLYHTANNKQRQLHGRRQMFTKVNDFLGQLNTIQQNAQREMNRRLAALSDSMH